MSAFGGAADITRTCCDVGNQYFDTAATDPPQTSQYTIILISSRDFVFADQEGVFLEVRIK